MSMLRWQIYRCRKNKKRSWRAHKTCCVNTALSRLFCHSGLFSINVESKRVLSPDCLRLAVMTGSWLQACRGELLLQSTQTWARTQTGALNLTLSPSLPGTMGGICWKILPPHCWHFSFSECRSSQNRTMTACVGQTAQTNHIREQCGTHCRAVNSQELRNVMTKLQWFRRQRR